MARKYMGPRWTPPRAFDGRNELDKLLADAEGAINGPQKTYLAAFEAECEAIEADDGLSEKGKQRAFAKVAAKYHNHPNLKTFCDEWIARAEAKVQQIETKINASPFVEPEGTMAQQNRRAVGARESQASLALGLPGAHARAETRCDLERAR